MNEQRKTCLNCGTKIDQPGTGRKRTFCKNRCKTAYHREKFLREKIEAQRQLAYIHFTHLKQWEALDQETTRITLTRIAQDYGAGAVFLAMQAIEQEVTARYKRPPRIKKRRSGNHNEIETEAIIGEAEPLEQYP